MKCFSGSACVIKGPETCGGKEGGKETFCPAMASTDKCALNETKSRPKSSSKVPSNSSLNSTSICNDSQSLCLVYEKPINDETEGSIFCEGTCKGWMHETCAGLSKIAFNIASKSDDDFLCHYCSSKCMRDEIKALKERVSSLEALL